MKILKYFIKSFLLLSLLFWSNYSNAQVNLQASISPSQLSIGDTFIYTLSVDAGGAGIYSGAQIKLDYDPTIIEFKALNENSDDGNIYDFDDYIFDDINISSGIIRYVVGANNIPANIIFVTLEFEVIGSAPIAISHLLKSEGVADGTNLSLSGFDIPITANDINQVLSVEEDLIFKNSIFVYPNPSSNVLYVNVNQSNEVIEKINFFDITGRTVKTVSNPVFNGNQIQINTSSLSGALYFMHVTSESGNKAVFRIIIDK